MLKKVPYISAVSEGLEELEAINGLQQFSVSATKPLILYINELAAKVELGYFTFWYDSMIVGVVYVDETSRDENLLNWAGEYNLPINRSKQNPLLVDADQWIAGG